MVYRKKRAKESRNRERKQVGHFKVTFLVMVKAGGLPLLSLCSLEGQINDCAFRLSGMELQHEFPDRFAIVGLVEKLSGTHDLL